ncbi:AMP-binding protein [Nocardia sp. NPDC051463]|uniref:AMP-binding protein n=1 Tax=Nocardia sp. NPDC051463 TaxID=3154845 RepID=UPI0034192DD0
MTGLAPIGHRGPMIASEWSASVAIEWCGRRLTYAQLESAIATLAEQLTALGAARASVLVMGPLCPAYVVGLLACFRAGAVPVPVDAGLTVDQYRWLEQRTCPAALVSSDVTPVEHCQLATTGTAELVLDAGTGATIVAALPETDWPARIFDDPDAGYVIPTSGSTGEPKAVVGSHRGLDQFLTWFRREFGLAGTDRCTALTRVNFDPSLRELLGVLGVGGVLSLPPVDAQLDLPGLADYVVDSTPTTLFLVPSLATRLAGQSRLAAAGLPDVRLIFFAGEVLGRRVIDQWAAIAPSAEIVNLYGQTEATLAQLYQRDAQRLVLDAPSAIPVGKPRPGVAVTFADPDSSGIGEVLIAADTPALGVLAPADAPRMHRVARLAVPLATGDLGYRGSDGAVVIVGRAGNDIKFGGRRVSFHRFIDAVEALPDVRQCVVVDHNGPQVFVATELFDDAVGEPLRGKVHSIGRSMGLPRFTLHLCSALPMLRSGKVDRQALLGSIDRTASDATAVETYAEIEHAEVERALRTMLGLATDDIGFVDSGITSLDMLELVARISRGYGIRLTVPECFALRDVPSLAREVEARRHLASMPITAAAAVSVPEAAAAYPLSTRQVAYMWICMSGGNANWCNISREIQLDRPQSGTAVTKAVRALFARHDVLGSALTSDWRQQSYTAPAELSCRVGIVDTGAETSSAAFRAAVQAARAAVVTELIDPEAAPPIRLVLVQGIDGCSVVLVAHHLFIDGLGLDVLADELRTVLTGHALDVAEHRDTYRDYCLATARSPRPGVAAEYWRDLLRDVTQVRLPEADSSDSAVGELRSMPFGALAARAVHRIAEEFGVSAFTVVLAAFDRAVAEVFGFERLPIIVASQSRENFGAATVGMFTTTLIVRGPGTSSLRRNIAAIAEQLADGAQHSGWEFDQRIADLGLSEADSFPLSTVLFNQHPMPRHLRARDLGAWQPRSLGRALRYQLQGELQMSGPEMVMTYYYRRGIAGTDVIDRVHRNVLRMIRAQEAIHG